jgi:hypothetical protein
MILSGGGLHYWKNEEVCAATGYPSSPAAIRSRSRQVLFPHRREKFRTSALPGFRARLLCQVSARDPRRAQFAGGRGAFPW